MIHRFTDREAETLLCALRNWQMQSERGTAVPHMSLNHEPLTIEEMDGLAERLNGVSEYVPARPESMEETERLAIIESARMQYAPSGEDIEIDEYSDVDESDPGSYWVSARVWVRRGEEEEGGES